MLSTVLNTIITVSSEVAPAVTEAAISGGKNVWFNAFLAIAAAFSIAIGVLGAGGAMGKIAHAAIEGTARQPEIGGRLFTTMLIAMALVEALAIYCLLISFMLIGKIG
ncbi:MAG: ATP synthase F0 subunit C [bacterium]